MKTVQIYSVNFLIKKSKVKNGLAPIYCRIAVDGKRAEIALKQAIPPNKWSIKASRAIGSSEESRLINNHIDILRNKLLHYHNQLLLENKPISAMKLKNGLLGKGTKQHTLLTTFQYHNERIKEVVGLDIQLATYVKYETVRKKLEAFVKETYHESGITLNELTYSFITDFEFFLKTKERIGHNTAMKYIHCFRKVIHMSVKNGWMERNPFVSYKTTIHAVKRDQLTLEEIDKLKKKSLHCERLEEVRDIFIFCCYTGYAYIDVKKLTREDLVTGIDGEKWIFTERTKTSITSNVPLLPEALKIVRKYEDNPYCRNHNKLLPVKSNQKMNAYLKEIAAITGVKKNLTMHMARHTFATTITLSNGVPIETVSKMLGHNRLATTQIYAKVLENKVSEDMNTLRSKLGEAQQRSQEMAGNQAG